MSSTPYIHLHLHTEYSLLDGFNPIGDLAKHCHETGVKAVAMTDHGNLYGYYPFYKAMKAVGVKPIIGCEIYLNPLEGLDKSSYKDPDSSEGETAGRPSLTHMTLLASNATGFRNLSRMVSRANVSDFYYKPVVTDENLEENAEGIICLSGCMTGRISRAILNGRYDIALEHAGYLRDVFGRENFFIEVHNHGMPEQVPLAADLRKIARTLNVPLVAANDVHYLRKEDAPIQDALVALNMGKLIHDPNRMSFMGYQEYFFKNREEMASMFSGMEEALDGPEIVAERCNVELDLEGTHFPSMPGYSKDEAVAAMRSTALAALGGRVNDTPEYRERLEAELSVVEKSGFADYFLIVAEIRKFAREKKIPFGPARGSVAGSLQAHAMDITDIDPLKYDLLFERFLNPERVSPPDIDMDFCSVRREEIITHIREKYGADRVSQVVTFGTYAPKSAIRDAFRGYNLSISDGERVSRMVDTFEGDKALYFASNKELQAEKAKGGDIEKAIDLAERIVGLPSQVGVHPAAVVITPGPTQDYVPLGRAKNGNPVTMCDMDGVTALGLLKLDVLGLKTCTIVGRAVDMVRENGIDLDIQNIPEDDAKTGDIYANGNGAHVFQIEDPSIQQFAKKMPVRSVRDFALATSLCRPGPMKFIGEVLDRVHGMKPIVSIHPKANGIGEDTYGILIYQEQVMMATRQLAGFSMGAADLVRRAMGKKDSDKFEAVRHDFMDGCAKNGIPEHEAEAVFDLLADFVGYGFNKSHAIAYATLSWQTAYLKAHHPTEFFAAALSCENKAEKIGAILRDAQYNGVVCSPPDVNKSLAGFSGRNGEVFFGLSGIAGIRAASVDAIVANKPYRDIYDFCSRTLPLGVTTKDLRVMAEAGALDAFGDRGALLHYVTNTSRAKLTSEANKHAPSGGDDLFAVSVPRRDPIIFEAGDHGSKPLSDVEKFLMEKKVMGFTFSTNPLSQYLGLRHVFGATPIAKLIPGTDVKILALVESKEIKKAKSNGNQRGTGCLSDESGQLGFVAWASRGTLPEGVEISTAYSRLRPGHVFLISGKVDQGGQLSLFRVEEMGAPIPPSKYSILVDRDHFGEESMQRLLDVTMGDSGFPVSITKIIMSLNDVSEEPVGLPEGHSLTVTYDVFADIMKIPGVEDIQGSL